jgi:hypothetical protein
MAHTRSGPTFIDLTEQDRLDRKEQLYEAILTKLDDIEAALMALVNSNNVSRN